MTTAYIDPTAGFNSFAFQARTDDIGTPVDDADGEDLRAVLGILTPGIIAPAAGFRVSPDSGLDITVGAGVAFTDLAIIAGQDLGQGQYLVRLGDALTTITIEAADLSNPRIDQIWVVALDDQYDSTGLVLARLAVTKGTPAASPSAPGPDAAWKAHLLLANVLVAAGVTVINAGDITDQRTFAESALVSGGYVPTGALIDFAGTVAPAGFLLADGAAVSRSTYARLFAAIGVGWGAGNGSTTFNVPDIRGRIKIGAGGTPALAVAATAGTWNHTHTGASHTHGVGTLAVPDHASHTHGRGTLAVPDHATHSHAGGSHTHSFSDSFTTGTGATSTQQHPASGIGTTHSTSGHTHSGTAAGTTGAGSATTGTGGPTTHGTITGDTATGGPTTHGALTGATAADGTGATGTANPPVAAVLAIVKT